MKKTIMILAATAALSTTAMAETENMFYLKGAVGGQYLNEIKSGEYDVKLKSSFAPYIALGTGYYIMDNARADLTLEYFFNPTFKKTVDGDKFKSKGKIFALMVNGAVDLVDISAVKIFAGAGVGLAQISEKTDFDDGKGSTKKATNFAYALTIGASTELAQGVTGELSYSWKDFGKTKSALDSNDFAIGKSKFKGHHVAFGVRFDI